MSVHLPTRRKSLRAINRSNCVEPHAGLWLDRFITEQGRENKEARRNLVADVAKIQTPDCYRMAYNRWKQVLESFRTSGYAIETQAAKVNGRMVLGTGNESVLETAVTLH